MTCRGDTLLIYLSGYFRPGNKRIKYASHVLWPLPQHLCLRGLFVTGRGTGVIDGGDNIPLLCHLLCKPVQVPPVAAKTMRKQQ
ncbi:hypothetical protein SR38_14170 [Atlantibacter hermannii]|nr:hypothetical protein SR38_14170 [Atlantibacter hermannii]